MKKIINIPKVNIVTLKRKERNNFPGYPVYPLIENIYNKSQNRLILIQKMFQNKSG
ncbi:hypothetical protein ACM55M_04700 [Flavobacterium sp. ZT3R25]|uniref:hypothetical protein n=1 Tax=Flavobacterium galactosi TaxID=3398735 RepID=UPI003A85B920